MCLIMFLKYMTEQKKITRIMLCSSSAVQVLGFPSLAALSDPLVFLSLTTAFLLFLPQV